jgi:hypothetical protein
MHLAAGRLDRQIAGGSGDPPSVALALRIEHLTGRRSRQRLARSLRRVVAYARRNPSRPYFSAVMIEPAPVRASWAALLGLADRLDGPDPVSARGIVLVRALLTDGANSPLFNAHCDRTVDGAVWEIADALGTDVPPAMERHPIRRW